MPAKQWKVLASLIIVVLLVSACQSTTAPAPTSAGDLPFVVPAPKAGLGVIKGQVVDAKSGKAPVISVYLGKNLTADKPEVPPLVSMSLQNSPRGVYNETTGEFYFYDLKPDSYVFVFLLPPSQMQYKRIDDKDTPLTIVVEAGKTKDIGVVKFP